MLTRRSLVASTGAVLLASCQRWEAPPEAQALVQPNLLVPPDPEPFPVDPVDLSKLDPRLHRQVVADPTGERPGTIVVDIDSRLLHLVLEDGQAMRYGVGVGREGFAWSGRAVIRRKAKWPTWTPPAAMIRRQPELAEYAGGMPGGPQNPLGARALYLYEGGRDTLFRLHGTNEPWTIGSRVSSGCIRLLNVDIIDLYDRVPIGTRVLVVGSANPDPTWDS